MLFELRFVMTIFFMWHRSIWSILYNSKKFTTSHSLFDFIKEAHRYFAIYLVVPQAFPFFRPRTPMIPPWYPRWTSVYPIPSPSSSHWSHHQSLSVHTLRRTCVLRRSPSRQISAFHPCSLSVHPVQCGTLSICAYAARVHDRYVAVTVQQRTVAVVRVWTCRNPPVKGHPVKPYLVVVDLPDSFNVIM